MKPITFENLRRLMGGGRKKKDRGESSFKRSDSFKRISIKRSYLERGGRSRIPHPPGGKGRQSEQASPSASPTPPPAPPPATPPDPVVIGYGQWIRCQLRPKQPSCSSSSDERPPTPPPRRRGSSIATDTSLEIIRLDRSPVVVRRRPGAVDSAPAGDRDSRDGDKEAASRPDSAISVNLGRVWLDAPMALAMAPRSLELPRPPPQAAPQAPQPGGGPGGACRRAHHSLDSALKESRRFLTPRALSSHARDSRITSSKDSGFSFSISIPRLADVSPASLSPPPGLGSGSDGAGGFFRRRKKLSKPAPSVSRDGYFKRTSCGSLSGAPVPADAALAANNVRRSSSRRKKGGPGAVVASGGRGSVRGSTRGSTRGSGRRKKTATPAASVASGTVRSDIYQVVVGRAPRSLNALKLDPMIFVAPEKRKPATAAAACSRRLPHRYEVQEIRGAFVPRECPAVPRHSTDTEEDEGLYISPRSAGSLRASSAESLDRLDSLDEADTSPVVATPTAAQQADEPADAPRRPSVTIKTKRNHVTRVMINMPSEGSSSDASDADDDDADEGLDEGDEELYAPPGFSPVPRCRNVHGGVAARKPVQRRKSARRNVKYLAKPNIHRAPSTLRRARKCEYAALQRRLVAALDTAGTHGGAHAAHDKSPESDSDGEWI